MDRVGFTQKGYIQTYGIFVKWASNSITRQQEQQNDKTTVSTNHVHILWHTLLLVDSNQ